MTATDLTAKLDELFAAERAVRTLHATLGEMDPEALVACLRHATGEAIALEDGEEAALRLVRISALLGEQEGPAAVDLLIDILGHGDPEVRHAAGEALEGIAFDRFKEAALGVERAVDRLRPGNPALTELPYLLVQVGEPGVVKLLGKFLGHKDPEAVAAAIESLVELEDPAAAQLLLPLERDGRVVLLEDDEGGEDRVTLGELAREARQLLTGLDRPPPKTPRGKSSR